jgi:hypothetical protein
MTGKLASIGNRAGLPWKTRNLETIPMESESSIVSRFVGRFRHGDRDGPRAAWKLANIAPCRSDVKLWQRPEVPRRVVRLAHFPDFTQLRFTNAES